MLWGASAALSRSADTAGVLLVGGLLTLLTWVATPVWVGSVLAFPPLVALAPLALAPALVRRGYLVRIVADAGATGNRAGAPPFVAWNRLYRDGLKSALLSALLLAPLALLLAVVALAGAAVGTGSVDPAPAIGLVERALGERGVPAVVAAGGGILTVVTAAYLLAFAYVRPAALAAFAASGRLRDALRPRRPVAVAGSGAYATAWVVAVATVGAGYALAAPFVPLVVGVAFVFAVRVVAHALYGRGAAEAVEFGVAEPSGSTGSAASPASRDRGSGSHPDRSPAPGRPEPSSTQSAASPDRLDGGYRRATREAPAAIQIGRPVPLDLGGTGDGGGFEWSAERDDEVDGDPGDNDEVDGDPGDNDEVDTGPGDDVDGGFQWGAGVDPEDKS